MSLPGYEKLELSGVLDATTAQLVQLVIDAVKSGKKKARAGCGLGCVASWHGLPRQLRLVDLRS